MPNEKAVSRRAALRSLVVIAAGSAAFACSKKELSCADTNGLSPADLSTRTALDYVDHSTVAGKECGSCQLFTLAAPDACGACSVVKGPINPKGYCKSWVQKS